MKQIQKRMLLQILIGFLLGRVQVFDVNPFGTAYFAAGLLEGGAVMPVAIAILFGMISSLSIENAICNGMVMIALILSSDFLQKAEIEMKMGHAAIIGGAATAVLSFFEFYLMPYREYAAWFIGFSALIVIFCTRVFNDGLHFMLHSVRAQEMNNEEMISLVLIGGLAVWGLPDTAVGGVVIMEVLLNVLILVMGYCYGTGAGAMAGAAAGVLLVLCGNGNEMVGAMAVLGICAGMLREQGKLWTLAAYVGSASAIYFVLNDGSLPAGHMKALAIAAAVFILLPNKYLSYFGGPGKHGRPKMEVQEILQKRLIEFSEVFHQLSKTIKKQNNIKHHMSGTEQGRMAGELSGHVCRDCSDRDGCLGQFVWDRPEIRPALALAQESGELALEQLPIDFQSQCTHIGHFIDETNRMLNLSRVFRGMHRRMAESRKVMAGQIDEVGDIIGNLAKTMPQVQELSEDARRRFRKALRARNVAAEEIFVYKKPNGRMEISIQAKTVKGRLVTAGEVARVLSEIMECDFIPSEASRKVLLSDMMEFCFQEALPLKALTGVARRAKEGEEISGDAFSCVSLSGGEVLLALSDGMGSGMSALEESRMVIDLLEQMVDAGFSQSSSMNLINSLYLNKDGDDRYATADIALLDLYEGNCCFVKNGAAATYLRHGEVLECIEGQALPVGVSQEFEPFSGKVAISAGDYVIMMTDGISDSFIGTGSLAEFIKELDVIDPKEIAERILQEAVDRQNGKVLDDMSVIVAGIWEN